jgi:hypothetical protein
MIFCSYRGVLQSPYFLVSTLLIDRGLQITAVLAQYDAQKGCRPRRLCSGDADGLTTMEEFSDAVSNAFSDLIAPPLLREILYSNLPITIPKSYITVNVPVKMHGSILDIFLEENDNLSLD